MFDARKITHEGGRLRDAKAGKPLGCSFAGHDRVSRTTQQATTVKAASHPRKPGKQTVHADKHLLPQEAPFLMGDHPRPAWHTPQADNAAACKGNHGDC